MPYKHTEKLIPSDKKRSSKYTEEDREKVRQLYAGGRSINGIARDTGMSKRTVQFVLFPERREASYRARVARGGSKIYYDREAHRKAMKKHRDYKEKLYRNNELE